MSNQVNPVLHDKARLPPSEQGGVSTSAMITVEQGPMAGIWLNPNVVLTQQQSKTLIEIIAGREHVRLTATQAAGLENPIKLELKKATSEEWGRASALLFAGMARKIEV